MELRAQSDQRGLNRNAICGHCYRLFRMRRNGSSPASESGYYNGATFHRTAPQYLGGHDSFSQRTLHSRYRGSEWLLLPDADQGLSAFVRGQLSSRRRHFCFQTESTKVARIRHDAGRHYSCRQFVGSGLPVSLLKSARGSRKQKGPAPKSTQGPCFRRSADS